MAEMTSLIAALYRKYTTRVKEGKENTSPGISSKFEVFHDETKRFVKVRNLRGSRIEADSIKEHECYITFEKQAA